jgi:dipeptidyl aminopeptidase/acylaminoacyl peptidase
MPTYPRLENHDERNNWPSSDRPDGGPPPGWSHALAAGIDRPRSHTLSPDGSQIAFFWERDDCADLYVMPASGGWPARLTFGRSPRPYWFDEAPHWSPDGAWLAYTDQEHAWVVAAQGGLPRQVSAFTTAAGSPRWLTDSAGIVLTHEQDELCCLLLSDWEGGWPRQLTPYTGRDHDPQPSPDGRYVAYVHSPPDDLERADIHLVRLSDGAILPLTATPGRFNRSPRWSPDGQRLAYVSQRLDFYDLYVYDLQSGQERLFARLGWDLDEPYWSPDGGRLVCTANRRGAFDLLIVEVETGAVSDLRRGNGFHARPQWAPDGRTITFEYDSPLLPPDIYRLELETRQATQLTFSMPPALAALDFVQPQEVTYPSQDGLEIPALLYQPGVPNGAGIVYPHGGPTAQHALEWETWVQYMLAKGYTVLAVNQRGSTGYGLAFERANYHTWGVGDTQDCLAAADVLAGQGLDPRRLAIYGASYGAFLAICCLAHDPQHRFACGVAKYGDCDMFTSWAQCDRSGRDDLYRMLGHPAENRQAYRAASPVTDVAHIRAPLLIVHGLLDPYVPPLQSEELVEALRREGKTYEYKTYPEEEHGIFRVKNLQDYYARMERFLDWYLSFPQV